MKFNICVFFWLVSGPTFLNHALATDAINPGSPKHHTANQANRPNDNLEKAKGTVNYHGTKKLYHEVEKEAKIDRLNASLHHPRAGPSTKPVRNQYDKGLRLAISTHDDKINKHEKVIQKLKEGKILPGTKDVRYIRDRGKLPKGYQ